MASDAKKALLVRGGYEDHQPVEVGDVLAKQLRDNGFEVEISDTLEAYGDLENLKSKNLIVHHWTMGKLEREQAKNFLEAVRSGVGLAGCHGGLCDSFRDHCTYQFMTGGQWVAHPGNIIDYRVHIVDHADPITAGINHFDVHSEQYYLHVDPSNHVLATTTFEVNGCTMPVVWKRMWGQGKVFYSSLGHVAKEFEVPETLTIMTRGMLWAAR